MDGLSIWTIVSIAEVAWIPIATIFIVMQRRTAPATLAWIFALALLPVVGLAVYFFLGPRRFERQRRRRAEAAAVVRAVPDGSGQRCELPSRRWRQLVQLCHKAAGASARPRVASIRVFADGDELFAALLDAVSNAKHHVHCEYYIWEPDRIGTRLRDALVERARHGVEVRVLIDDLGSGRARDRFWAPLRAVGGEVARFNEVSLRRWRPRMANFRTHRKIVVVDGATGFTGGMNVTDVHLAQRSGAVAWRDTHLELRGPAVRGLQTVFFEDWHCAVGDAPDGDAYFSDTAIEGGELVQVVASGPDETTDAIHKLFFSAIVAARQRVLLTTPYFVPDETLVAALTTAALSGVDVNILIPARGDLPLVDAAASTYYPELIEHGVRVFAYESSVLHAKTLLIDDAVAIVGTANADNRSFRLNFEIVVVSYEGAACQRLAELFAADLASSSEITCEHWSEQPFRRRLLASAARLFSPIL